MNNKHAVGLTSTEIAGLWSTYITDSMSICFCKHFLHHHNNTDIEQLVSESLKVSQTHMTTIQNIFKKENLAIPKGFSDKDVDLTAPPLFFDLFPISYIYGMSRIALLTYGMITSNVARDDVRQFFSNCLQSTLELYNKTVDLMLSKGIYDRPPMIPYPDHVEFLKKKGTFLSKWFEKNRPLNVLELSEMFFNIERNYFGMIFLTGFIQVTKDKAVKKYCEKGKTLAMNQIKFLNETMIKDDLLGTIMVNNEVTTSTVSPFSDRLIMSFINATNSVGLTYIGHALSASTRLDLIGEYSRLLAEIMQYGKEGMDMMIDREWLEEPPHAPDRKSLSNV